MTDRATLYSMSDYDTKSFSRQMKKYGICCILNHCSKASQIVIELLQNAGYKAEPERYLSLGGVIIPHWKFTIKSRNRSIKQVKCSATVNYHIHDCPMDIVEKPNIDLSIQYQSDRWETHKFVNVYDMITFLNRNVGL